MPDKYGRTQKAFMSGEEYKEGYERIFGKKKKEKKEDNKKAPQDSEA